jgi:pyruvate carboxylase
MWGGATFDTSMRFLKECPGSGWPTARADPEHPVPDAAARLERRRLHELSRQRGPRVREESADAGIDVFRVFDALNWVPNMRVAMEEVLAKTGAICEAAICYTGDILDPAGRSTT